MAWAAEKVVTGVFERVDVDFQVRFCAGARL